VYLHIAGFDHEDESRDDQEPERGGDGVHVHDEGDWRQLVEIVVQVEAEADADDDPEDGKPDKSGATVAPCRPGCR